MCFRDSCRKEEEEEEDPTKLVSRRTGNYDAGRLDEKRYYNTMYIRTRPARPTSCVLGFRLFTLYFNKLPFIRNCGGSY